MTAFDPIARGMASGARSALEDRARILLATGPSGPIYGGTGAEPVTVCSTILPPDSIPAGAMLRIHVNIAKYQPYNAGHYWRLRLGDITVAQNSVGASIGAVDTQQTIHMAHDRKSAFALSINTLGQPSIDQTGMFGASGAALGAGATLNARQPSGAIMFVAYSQPPTKETVLVDFTRPVMMSLDILARNGDTVEVLGALVEVLSAGAEAPRSTHPKALALWGDSLVEGAGASVQNGVPMDWAAQLRRRRASWPVAAKGLGGQTARQIVDRMLDDAVAGRTWRAVICAGANDFDRLTDGETLFAELAAQFDRALAYRGDAPTLVCNFYPRASWQAGGAQYDLMMFVNARLAGQYGDRICDLHGALATQDGKVPTALMADDIHLSNAGYTIAMEAVDAAMTRLEW